MERNLLEEKDMIILCAKVGVEIALSRLNVQKDEISQREAYRLWGVSTVKRWVKEGLIIGIKSGTTNSKVIFSRLELELLKSLEDKQNQKLQSI